MPAEHDQAQRQRGRDDQPDRAPDPGPEDRGDNYGNRRQARAVAVDERLDRLPHDQFGDSVEHRRPDRHRPAGLDGRRQHYRQRGGDPRSDIGNEAQQRAENAPQQRVGNADEIKADADDHAKAGIEAELGQEIAAEPPPGLVHRHGGAVQIARAEQPDGAVAQILLLQQGEYRHHQNDACRRQRIQHRLQNALADVEH